MAVVPKDGTPSLASKTPTYENQLAAIADGDLAAGDPCYISGMDSTYKLPKLHKSGKTNRVDYWAGHDAPDGEAITGLKHVRMHYGSGMTPGILLYLDGTTAGVLNTAAATSGNPAVALTITDEIIEVRTAAAGS